MVLDQKLLEGALQSINVRLENALIELGRCRGARQCVIELMETLNIEPQPETNPESD